MRVIAPLVGFVMLGICFAYIRYVNWLAGTNKPKNPAKYRVGLGIVLFGVGAIPLVLAEFSSPYSEWGLALSLLLAAAILVASIGHDFKIMDTNEGDE